MSINHRALAYCTCLVLLAATTIAAQQPFSYREFQLGSDVASVEKLTGGMSTAAKIIHTRPAVIAELEWRPRYSSRGESTQTDPVDTMLLRFYDDQLYTIIVDYDRRRTEGMAAADIISAVSETYGPTSMLTSRAIGSTAGGQGLFETPIATWGDAEYSVTLLRGSQPDAFRLVVTSIRLDNLARKASATAVKMDTAEAPQRELARQKKEAEDSLAARQKAKTENKAQFKP
jgi:hypothetical protein